MLTCFRWQARIICSSIVTLAHVCYTLYIVWNDHGSIMKFFMGSCPHNNYTRITTQICLTHCHAVICNHQHTKSVHICIYPFYNTHKHTASVTVPCLQTSYKKPVSYPSFISDKVRAVSPVMTIPRVWGDDAMLTNIDSTCRSPPQASAESGDKNGNCVSEWAAATSCLHAAFPTSAASIHAARPNKADNLRLLRKKLTFGPHKAGMQQQHTAITWGMFFITDTLHLRYFSPSEGRGGGLGG